jgi:hypothetical protein
VRFANTSSIRRFKPRSRAAVLVIEGLEARRLLTATVSSPIGNQVFAQDSGSESANLAAVFADTNGLSDLSFSATSSNPTVVSASITGSTLTLTPQPGRSGFAIIQMTATDPLKGRASNVFRVQITASASRTAHVTLGSSLKSFSFAASNQASATVALKGPGTADVLMGGDGLKLNGASLHGANQELESITLSGTTAATSLIIAGTGASRFSNDIGNVTATGALGLLEVKGAALLGDVTISGGLGKVNADLAQAGTINAGPAAVTIQGQSYVDENFSSTGPVRDVKISQWLNSDNVSEMFSATSIARVSTRGSFDAGLQLSGSDHGLTLGSMKVPGTIGGQWMITGSSAPLNVGGTASDWNATIGNLPSVTVRGTFAGSLTVPSLRFLKVGGDMSFSSLTLTATGTNDLPLLKTAVLDRSLINAAGSIGKIEANALQYSGIFAGVSTIPAGDVLPASVSDLSSSATIASIVLHPKPVQTGLLGTNIAAANLGVLLLASTRTDNNHTMFGVAASTIKELIAIDKSRPQTIRLLNVQNSAQLAAQLAAEKITFGNLIIRGLS